MEKYDNTIAALDRLSICRAIVCSKGVHCSGETISHYNLTVLRHSSWILHLYGDFVAFCTSHVVMIFEHLIYAVLTYTNYITEWTSFLIWRSQGWLPFRCGSDLALGLGSFLWKWINTPIWEQIQFESNQSDQVNMILVDQSCRNISVSCVCSTCLLFLPSL